MSTRAPIFEDYLAGSEDGDWIVFRREGLTRWQARRLVADQALEPVTSFTVRAGYVRPADKRDCDERFYIEEQWHFACERSHPRAIPVWVVEPA